MRVRIVQNVGYCQGMNYLVATFLLVGMAEDMAFWMLAAVVERILPQTYFSRSLVGVQADQKVVLPLGTLCNHWRERN